MTKKGKKKAPAQPVKSKYKPAYLWAGLSLAGLAVLLYINTLGHDFAYDDSGVIRDNYIINKGLAGIPEIFTTSYRHGSSNDPGTLYRPLSQVMFAFEWAIAPESPFPGHLVNVLLYGLTAWLMWVVLLRWMPQVSPWILYGGIALFIAHPLHTEAVANIKSRDEILVLLFFLLSLYGLLRSMKEPGWTWLVISYVSYFAALFSRESAVTMVAAFPLFLYFFSKTTLGEIIKKTIPYALLALVFILIRAVILGNVTGVQNTSQLDNLLEGINNSGLKLTTTLYFIGLYVQKMIWPHPLVSDLGFNQVSPKSFSHPMVIGAALLLLATLAHLFLKTRKKDFLAFCAWFFIIVFSIYSNLIVSIGSNYGERFLYTALLGFTLGFMYLISKIFHLDVLHTLSLKGFTSRQMGGLTLVGLLVLVYSGLTLARNPAWKNDLTLHATDIKNAPNSAKTNYHLGLEYNRQAVDTPDVQIKQQLFTEAVKYIGRSLEIYPEYPDALGTLALIHYRNKQYDQALTYYERANQVGPTARNYSNMGAIYFERGDLATAQGLYEKAVSLDPRFSDARQNLGSIFARQRQFTQAIEQYLEGLKYDPNHIMLNYFLGLAYRDNGQAELGRPYLERAKQLNPALQIQ